MGLLLNKKIINVGTQKIHHSTAPYNILDTLLFIS
jgi:hypothetical protein